MGKDDGADWYVVILADTPRIDSASPDDKEAFAKLIRDRIDQVKATLG